jgi:hypothetical protein
MRLFSMAFVGSAAACTNPVVPIAVQDEWRGPRVDDGDCVEVVAGDVCRNGAGCPDDVVAVGSIEDFAAAREALESQCIFGPAADGVSNGECAGVARCVDEVCVLE